MAEQEIKVTRHPKISVEETVRSLILERVSATEADTSKRKNDYFEHKRFFLAREASQFDGDVQSDSTRRPFPVASMIDLYFRDLIAGSLPDVRVVPPDLSKQAQEEEDKAQLEKVAAVIADGTEKVIDLALRLNDIDRQFYDNALVCGVMGDAFVRIMWDPEDKRGGKNGTPIIDFLPPERVRIGWASNNFREVEYYITTKKMTPTAVKDLYGVEVVPDVDVNAVEPQGGSLKGWTSLPTGAKDFPLGLESEFEGQKTDIPMVQVHTYWDKERYAILVGTDNLVKNVEHKYGFVPIFHIPNMRFPGEPWGYPDHYFIMDAQKSLNFLMNKAESIIAYQAGPVILDIGNTLKGRKLPSGNNVVVPIPIGNSMQYLQWSGNLFPVLQQEAEVKRTLLDIQGLPANLSATSGFMVQVQMIKALLRERGKKERVWGDCFRWLSKRVVELVLKFDKTELPKGVGNLQIDIKWPEVLPQDEARIFQNLSIAKTLGIMSDYTAIERYGEDSPFEEIRRIEDEQRRKALLASELQAQAQASLPQPAQPPQTQVPQPLEGGEMLQNIPGPETPPPLEGEAPARELPPASLVGA